jgi:CHAD domain-containing protein
MDKKLDSVRLGRMESSYRYKIPDSINIQEITLDISKNFSIKKESSIQCSQLFFDTFDWRLYDAGLLLIKENNEFMLCSSQSEIPIEKVTITSQIQMQFWWDFPDGSFKDTLKKILDVRALMPLVEIEKKIVPFRILNDDEKTVLKVKLENIFLIQHKQKEKLTDCIKLLPIRGYAQEFIKFKNWLNQQGIIEETKNVFLVALDTIGKKPGDYTSKLNFTLLPDMTAREATGVILTFLLQVIHQNLTGIKEDIDTEFLHDFRVAIRRTRSALSQIKGVFPKEVRDRFKADFAVLQKKTNRMRDLDVYLLNQEKYQQMLPDYLGPGLELLFGHLRAERTQEHKNIVKAISDTPYKKLIQQWDSFLNSIEDLPETKNSNKPAIHIARKFILKKYQGVIKIGNQIHDDSPSAQLHQLRIECKKLRYLLEFFASLFPEEEISLLIKQLKKLQDNLGDYNDLSVQQKSLKKYLEKTTSEDNDFSKISSAIGGLISCLYQQQQGIRKAFAQTFAEFSGMENEKIYQKLFA